MPTTAITTIRKTETLKQESVPSRSPRPTVLPQTTWMPAEIIAPRAAKTSSNGVEKP